jgi:hypothetical protein
MSSDEPASLLQPPKLWARSEILTKPCPVPKQPGVYAWYFRDLLPRCDIDGCHRIGELSLLYIGIAPSPPKTNGKPASSQTLRDRIRTHVGRNAEGSTLRLSLGCLLAPRLGLELRRVGGGTTLTFAAGEALLSDWIGANARVAWLTHAQPWTLESALIRALSLPLNLGQNAGHSFSAKLSALRAAARARARSLPIVGP